MIKILKKFGREDYFCDTCRSDSFCVMFNDVGEIIIMCRSCFEHMIIGITTGTHELLMKEAKK